jgi:hypothetical protein
MLVEGNELTGCDSQFLKQGAALAVFFANDDIGFPQNPNCPQGDIFGISDRGCNDV